MILRHRSVGDIEKGPRLGLPTMSFGNRGAHWTRGLWSPLAKGDGVHSRSCGSGLGRASFRSCGLGLERDGDVLRNRRIPQPQTRGRPQEADSSEGAGALEQRELLRLEVVLADHFVHKELHLVGLPLLHRHDVVRAALLEHERAAHHADAAAAALAVVALRHLQVVAVGRRPAEIMRREILSRLGGEPRLRHRGNLGKPRRPLVQNAHGLGGVVALLHKQAS